MVILGRPLQFDLARFELSQANLKPWSRRIDDHHQSGLSNPSCGVKLSPGVDGANGKPILPVAGSREIEPGFARSHRLHLPPASTPISRGVQANLSGSQTLHLGGIISKRDPKPWFVCEDRPGRNRCGRADCFSADREQTCRQQEENCSNLVSTHQIACLLRGDHSAGVVHTRMDGYGPLISVCIAAQRVPRTACPSVSTVTVGRLERKIQPERTLCINSTY